MSEANPSVTVAIPVLNEAPYMARVLQQFCQTSYPHVCEILVADGGSTDSTREIVRRFARADARVRLLDNPRKIQSAALKQMLAEARGEVFLRADAHCEYAPDYVEKCVEALQASQSLNAGGALRFVAYNAFQAAVAIAARSPLGGGRAKHRDPSYAGYADTVCFGCFWRDELEAVGGYRMTRYAKEDTELNLRLLARSPQAIYISPEVKFGYYPRPNWPALVRQYFKYGRGSYLIQRQYSGHLPPRNQLPFYGLLGLGILGLLDVIIPPAGLGILAVIATGFLTVGAEATRVVLRNDTALKREIWKGDPDRVPTIPQRCWLCMLVLLTMPIAHGMGYGYQFARQKIFRQRQSYFLEA